MGSPGVGASSVGGGGTSSTLPSLLSGVGTALEPGGPGVLGGTDGGPSSNISPSGLFPKIKVIGNLTILIIQPKRDNLLPEL